MNHFNPRNAISLKERISRRGKWDPAKDVSCEQTCFRMESISGVFKQSSSSFDLVTSFSRKRYCYTLPVRGEYMRRRRILAPERWKHSRTILSLVSSNLVSECINIQGGQVPWLRENDFSPTRANPCHSKDLRRKSKSRHKLQYDISFLRDQLEGQSLHFVRK